MAFGTVVSLQSPGNIIDLWKDYCEPRGLTDEILGTIGGELLTLDAAAKVVGPGIFSFKKNGAVGAYVFPIAANTFQARLVYDPDRLDSTPAPGEQAKPVKLVKYFKKKDSANYLYQPRAITDWYAETSYNLLIVEGALNAARLASDGYHAVGITGVFNYHVGNKLTAVIPELIRLIQSKQVERVTILFDSDTADQEEKRELWNGINAICQDLMKLRPDRKDTVFICRPPPKADGEKNGPDDYLQAMGRTEFDRLLREESARYDDHPYFEVERAYLERYIFDQLSGQFWDGDTRRMVPIQQVNLELMTFGMVDDVMSARPSRTAYTVDRGMKTGNTRKARGVMFNPATEDQFYLDQKSDPPEYRINKFNPADVPKAIKGDITPFIKLLTSVCRGSPAAIQKVLTICAYHAQNPDLTPKYAILFTGMPGCGKSTLARLIGLALSKKFTDVEGDLKPGSFNSNWRGFACKEWPEFSKEMDGEKLKNLITGVEYEVNTKWGAQYTERNHTLNIFTCNGLQSKIQEGDRRFIIGGYGQPDDKALGLEVERLTGEVGSPGLLTNFLRYHLLNEVDASGYDTMDVWTEMRDQVIDASKSYKSSVKDILIDDLSEMPGLEIAPNELLSAMLDPFNVNVISFTKENAQYFTKPAKEVVKINGHPTRFRCFKNHEKWSREVDTAKYREQHDMAMKLYKKLQPGKKFDSQ